MGNILKNCKNIWQAMVLISIVNLRAELGCDTYDFCTRPILYYFKECKWLFFEYLLNLCINIVEMKINLVRILLCQSMNILIIPLYKTILSCHYTTFDIYGEHYHTVRLHIAITRKRYDKVPHSLCYKYVYIKMEYVL